MNSADARLAGLVHPSPRPLEVQEVNKHFIRSCALHPDLEAGDALRPECPHEVCIISGVTFDPRDVDTDHRLNGSLDALLRGAPGLVLLPPPQDAATASPIPTPALEASSLVLAAAWSKSVAPSVHADSPASVITLPPTKCSMQVRNNFECRVSTSTAVNTPRKVDQMLKRYITDFTHAYSIGVVMLYSASEIHGVQRVFGKLIIQCPVPFWPFSAPVVVKAPWSPFMLFEIKGDAVHLSPIPWPFFCGYAAPVHLKTSLSVNTMLADSTQLCFGLWSPFYLCWFAVQSSGSVVQILVWPILMHENSAANMEHFPVSVQHKGKSLNPHAVFHMPLTVLYVVQISMDAARRRCFLFCW
ncbi:unnamed protein product [Miscanthus lutarioriparius]|uniref:Uncharacterized protein n=1 Tax=Miscanthus lutarioriparius TaxID=422564 RepID=A0A811QRW2_9POAL|nr:unnamed protein product [Miscanthus lutarioriparius]